MKKKKFVSLVSILLSLSIVLSNAITAFAAIEDDTNGTETVSAEELNDETSEQIVMSEEDARDYQMWLYEQKEPLPEYQDNNIVLYTNEDYSYNGSCGENITYSYNTETHTLKLVGNGRMEDYYGRNTSVPWYGYRSDIQYVNIDENITFIGGKAFYDCSSLKSVNLSKNIDEIGYYAFSYCSSLKTAVINSRTIRQLAFYDCDSLTEITLNNVENVEYGSFANCDSLTEINISNSVESLWDPFFDCTSLSTINVDEKNEYFLSENGILYNKNKSELILCPAKSTRNVIEIPSTVEIINKYAFQYNALVTINVEAGNKYYSSENGILYSKDKDKLVICPAKLQQNVLQIPSTVIDIPTTLAINM